MSYTLKYAAIFLIILLTLSQPLHSQNVNTSFNQLVQVNEQWKIQADADSTLEMKSLVNYNE